MLPFVMLPRPLQESNVVGKGGTAGFLGKAYDPYTLYPRRRRHGHDQDGPHQGRRPASCGPKSSPSGWSAGPSSATRSTRACRRSTRPSPKYDLDEYYDRALSLVISRPGARRVRPRRRDGRRSATRTAATRSARAACWPAGWSRPARASSRSIWPKVANSDNHSWDHHVGLTKRMKNQSGPMLDAGLSALIADLDERGLLDETLVVAVGEFGRSPQRGVSTSGNGNSADGRDHWPYCYTAVIAGAGIKRGYVHGKSRQDRLGPAREPGPSRRAAGDDLPRVRHRPGHDRLQPPQPAARAGQGRGRDPALRLIPGRGRTDDRRAPCPYPRGSTHRVAIGPNRSHNAGAVNPSPNTDHWMEGAHGPSCESVCAPSRSGS